MKKYLAMLCATMLCACCLGLAACGGSSSSSAAASGSASASAAESSSSASASASSASASSSAAAKASFVGTWKLAAMETEGITMSGNLSAMLDQNADMALTINEGGTGAMTFMGEEATFTWAEKDANTITLTVDQSADDPSESAESADATVESDVDVPSTIDIAMAADGQSISMIMADETFSGSIIFTKDGTYAEAKTIDPSAATAITSEDALIGTWTLCGMNMLGISMYGDPSALAAMSGTGDADMTIVFETGGKVTLMGSEATYTVSADGASIDEDGVTVPIMALDGDIIMDMSGVLGMDMVMVFSK